MSDYSGPPRYDPTKIPPYSPPPLPPPLPAESFFKQNQTLILFLIAQFIAIGGGAAAMLAYFTKLETRVSIMETRGAEYTVSRMEEMKLRINSLEQDIEKNERLITRIIDIMTRELGKPVPRQ